MEVQRHTHRNEKKPQQQTLKWHKAGDQFMPIFRIGSDAYRLIKSAHRLSDDAKRAVDEGSPRPVEGGWELSCTPSTAQELWSWFDGCEQHCALLEREAWRATVCRRAKNRIANAIGQSAGSRLGGRVA